MVCASVYMRCLLMEFSYLSGEKMENYLTILHENFRIDLYCITSVGLGVICLLQTLAFCKFILPLAELH